MWTSVPGHETSPDLWRDKHDSIRRDSDIVLHFLCVEREGGEGERGGEREGGEGERGRIRLHNAFMVMTTVKLISITMTIM